MTLSATLLQALVCILFQIVPKQFSHPFLILRTNLSLAKQVFESLLIRVYDEMPSKQVVSPFLHIKNHNHKFFSYIDLTLARTPKVLLKYAIGCPCCNITTPNSKPEALTSITNEREKLGMASIGAVVSAFLRQQMAAVACSVQLKESFSSCCVRGKAMEA